MHSTGRAVNDMDLQPPKKRQKQSNRMKNNAKTSGHMCSAKSKRQIIIVYELSFLFFVFLWLVFVFCSFGLARAAQKQLESTTSGAKPKKRHPRRKPKEKRKTKSQEKRPSETNWHWLRSLHRPKIQGLKCTRFWKSFVQICMFIFKITPLLILL